MMYSLNASGQTGAAGTLTPLWDAAASGTKLRLQNQSLRPLEVVVTLPASGGTTPDPLVVVLPGFGDFTDESWIDPTLAVGVRCKSDAGCPFSAVRIT